LLVLINSGLILNARIEARYVDLTFFSNIIIIHTLLDLKEKTNKFALSLSSCCSTEDAGELHKVHKYVFVSLDVLFFQDICWLLNTSDNRDLGESILHFLIQPTFQILLGTYFSIMGMNDHDKMLHFKDKWIIISMD
jgi:hypothetical protein